MWEWLLYVMSWYSLEDDFLKMYTFKTIAELNNCQEVCCYVHYAHIILKNLLKKYMKYIRVFSGWFLCHTWYCERHILWIKMVLSWIWYEDDYVSFISRYLRLPFFLFWFGKSDIFHFILILILILELPRLTLLLMLE